LLLLPSSNVCPENAWKIIDQTLRVDLLMGMGIKPRRTLRLIGKNQNSTSWRNQFQKHSPSHYPSIRAENKSLSNLRLERQSHIQPNFKHRCILQADININSPKLSALIFSHKAA